MGSEAIKKKRNSRSKALEDSGRRDRAERICSKESDRKDSTSKDWVLPNLVLHNIDRSLGLASDSTTSKLNKRVIISQIRRFGVHKTIAPFERRVTSITWHPKYPEVFVAGSKGGELVWHNVNATDDYFCPGVGAGGSILGLKCSDEDPLTVFTASLTGRLCSEDFLGKNSQVLFTLPMSYDNWFTSLDVCYDRHLLLSGDCSGNCYLLSTKGKRVWGKKKLHKSKVTHCEFNKRDPNIFVTASLDHTVKLWDLRFVQEHDNPTPVMVFPHVKAINSAYFSPSNGLSLLTTDQHSELRVYSSPCWNETLTITHPHRQFQHMTAMKAIWHPMEDIIIVGRYPDDNVKAGDVRTIDFYDGSTGQLLHNIASPTKNILTLNAVNTTGDILASTSGLSIVFLKDENIRRGLNHKCDSDDDTENKAFNPIKTRQRITDKKETRKKIPNSRITSKKF